MDNHNLELHLQQMKAAIQHGEIRLADLAAISAALQELNTRVARLITGQQTGRTPEVVAQIAQLRLTGLREGSTKLDIGYGDQEVLPDPDSELSRLEDETAERFWQIIEGISTGKRPDWTTPQVAQSALTLLDAFSHTATFVTVNRADERRLRIMTWVGRGPWQELAQATDAEITVAGTLFRVDLEARKFSIRDDVGNAIPLDDVTNSDTASALIGSRTLATGLAVSNQRGELKGVRAATVSRAPSVREQRHQQQQNQVRPWAPVPMSLPARIELTEQESDEFTAALLGN